MSVYSFVGPPNTVIQAATVKSIMNVIHYLADTAHPLKKLGGCRGNFYCHMWVAVIIQKFQHRPGERFKFFALFLIQNHNPFLQFSSGPRWSNNFIKPTARTSAGFAAPLVAQRLNSKVICSNHGIGACLPATRLNPFRAPPDIRRNAGKTNKRSSLRPYEIHVYW